MSQPRRRRTGFHARLSARSRARTGTACSLRRRARRSTLGGHSQWTRPARLDALHAASRSLLGEHDFRAFTPTETQHDVFVRNVQPPAGTSTGRASSSRSPRTASFGTWCGRSSARCWRRGRTRRPIERLLDGPAARRGRPDGASVRPLPRTGATTDRGYDRRGALPHRPLRPRRHADRLGADHPRVDAARGRAPSSGGRSRRGAAGDDRRARASSRR